MAELWVLELVADNLLDFGIVVGQRVFFQLPAGHVRRQGRARDWWICGHQHLGPSADVVFIDVLNNVVKFEL